MNTIYEPKDKAREYSPLALNLYSGCDHGCQYCYVPNIFSMKPNYKHSDTFLRIGVIEALRKDAHKFSGCQQVLLSFTTDPYMTADFEPAITRTALKILLANDIAVAILTKGGKRCLRDLDLFLRFGKHCKVGSSLTYTSEVDSLRVEPGAALPQDRFETLKHIHNAGVQTWVSLEPVCSTKQTLEVIDISHPYVDSYKVGKLNHFKDKNIDWHTFLVDAVNKLRSLNKSFYVKKDLAAFSDGFKLSKEETDMDRLLLPPFPDRSLF